MRIGIVNDMFMAAEALRRVLNEDKRHEVLWIAASGREAVEQCARQRPDLILMDLNMPEMDGVEATRRIMADTPCPILIVTASVEEHAAQVFAAMGAGALDAVNTPLIGFNGAGAGKQPLLAKIRTIELLTQPIPIPMRGGTLRGAPASGRNDFRMVGIGASSGGPGALAEILGQLPAEFPVPVVVIQHVDVLFAREFANWLGQQTPLPVSTVQSAVLPQPGQIYVSERENHLILAEDGRLAYTEEPRASPYRPSVDAFFHSVARNLRGKCVGILLTGMGRDGADGLLHLRQQGHVTVAQDKDTSAVYGMPRAAAELGAATHTLPIQEIAPLLLRAVKANRLLDTAI
jgi:two-component system response regulator WspF